MKIPLTSALLTLAITQSEWSIDPVDLASRPAKIDAPQMEEVPLAIQPRKEGMGRDPRSAAEVRCDDFQA